MHWALSSGTCSLSVIIAYLPTLPKLTALEVIEAFLPMAAYAQQAAGCLSDFFPEESRHRAKELDEMQARGEPLGLLHGLPMSIKVSDSTNVFDPNTPSIPIASPRRVTYS